MLKRSWIRQRITSDEGFEVDFAHIYSKRYVEYIEEARRCRLSAEPSALRSGVVLYRAPLKWLAPNDSETIPEHLKADIFSRVSQALRAANYQVTEGRLPRKTGI